MKEFMFAAKTALRQAGWPVRLFTLCLGFVIWTTKTPAGSLIATWDPNTEADLAGYIVYFGTESGNYTEKVDVKNTTMFVANDLIDGEEYYFTVKAYDLSGNLSAPASEANATVGGPMLVALKEDESIRLVWTPVPECDSYQIFQSHDPYFTPTTAIATVAATAHEYVDTQHFRDAEIQTYYSVRALKSGASLYDYDTVGAYDLDLQAGLNLISLPLVPADPFLRTILTDQLTGGENSAQADQLRLWNGEEYLIAWLYDGPAAEYNGKWISASTGQEANFVLDPNAAFWVAIQKDHPEKVLTITGRVPSEPERTIALKAGYNFVGCIYPVPILLEETELYQDGVMKGGVGSGDADILSAWNGNAYERAWVVDGVNADLNGTWMDETGKNATTLSFQPGDGYIIWIKGENSNKTWTFPNPALAE